MLPSWNFEQVAATMAANRLCQNGTQARISAGAEKHVFHPAPRALHDCLLAFRQVLERVALIHGLDAVIFGSRDAPLFMDA